LVKLILTIELVPQSCWFSNVRSAVSKKQWDIIKREVSDKAYAICQICGDIGPKHPVECHEIWHYDDKKLIQKLNGMIALCPDCHMVKHIGLAQVRGQGEKALKHFMKVNKLKKIEAEKYIDEAFALWAVRSNNNWLLDLDHLKEYGIDITKIKEK
jgi:5-methylcytosine-specific restriction endonuclease McrA